MAVTLEKYGDKRLRFVTLKRETFSEPGIVAEGVAVGLRGAGFHDLISLVAGGSDAMDRVARWVNRHPGADTEESAARFGAPIARPPKIICVGLNYRDHAQESGLAIPDTPTIFAKFPNCVIGPHDPIVLPRNSTRPDYEAELAVVIGRGGRHIAEQNWREHVFGYTILHDVSARDFQMATSQWMIGKTFDTFCPMGPAIVTADEIPDPHNLRISLTLNGTTMQDSNTANLIFKIPRLIAYLSSVFTLEPGDVIATGTPAGVGFARKPPVYLKPGDEVRIQIEGIGELVNPVVAEA
jgi:2-keto-4-pentenoate hydratase/2-oxohepta-3-ene-1,7-dioic acid hydratase in catechol pathway